MAGPVTYYYYYYYYYYFYHYSYHYYCCCCCSCSSSWGACGATSVQTLPSTLKEAAAAHALPPSTVRCPRQAVQCYGSTQLISRSPGGHSRGHGGPGARGHASDTR